MIKEMRIGEKEKSFKTQVSILSKNGRFGEKPK